MQAAASGVVEHRAPINKYLAGEFEPPLLQEKRNIPSMTNIKIFFETKYWAFIDDDFLSYYI